MQCVKETCRYFNLEKKKKNFIDFEVVYNFVSSGIFTHSM